MWINIGLIAFLYFNDFTNAYMLFKATRFIIMRCDYYIEKQLQIRFNDDKINTINLRKNKYIID